MDGSTRYGTRANVRLPKNVLYTDVSLLQYVVADDDGIRIEMVKW